MNPYEAKSYGLVDHVGIELMSMNATGGSFLGNKAIRKRHNRTGIVCALHTVSSIGLVCSYNHNLPIT